MKARVLRSALDLADGIHRVGLGIHRLLASHFPNPGHHPRTRGEAVVFRLWTGALTPNGSEKCSRKETKSESEDRPSRLLHHDLFRG